MAYQPMPVVSGGGINTSDDNVQQLLEQVLKELKRMNMHLALLSDLDLEDEEMQ